ncbi:haloacid dehalogenase-like hydrolase [Reichenbachiella agarivorans]|uniref:Haloacid dehalogenase-like hydrolase n=1 Tax=Reichenbachiella agarivorans TaxID=2979464 RepID=A0ABY6CPI9_9BACT|nr:HAD family hydrolase [Reichenbachiella agarivorans]UXP32441.1 haloacid dehalogenase-like hydrolase [Reichenbachiella agarivorans]
MKTLALFDFDGTLTQKDSLFEMAKHVSSPAIYYLKISVLIPVFTLMKTSLLSKQRGKEIFMQLFFGGMKIEDFNQQCYKFCNQRLPEIIRPKALIALQQYQENNTDTYIVSASPENWIKPWAEKLGIKVLSTQLEVQNLRITGRILGNNCNHEEKVNRIKNHINLTEYNHIVAYGDTKGDFPMLNLANTKHYKPFQ